MHFDELIELLVRGAGAVPSWSGIYTTKDTEDGSPRTWRVWRRGRLARVEDPPGNLVLIAGERSYWRMRQVDLEVVEVPRVLEYDDFELSAFTMLDAEEYWRTWFEEDRELVERTVRPVVHDGRQGWELTAPWVKGACSVLTIDAEAGVLLQARRDDVGVYESWTEVRTDEVLGDELFNFDGTFG